MESGSTTMSAGVRRRRPSPVDSHSPPFVIACPAPTPASTNCSTTSSLTGTSCQETMTQANNRGFGVLGLKPPTRRGFIRSYSDEGNVDLTTTHDEYQSYQSTAGRLEERTSWMKQARQRKNHARRLRGDDATCSAKSHRHRRRRRSLLIPAEHPLKVFWDIVTMVVSFANAYATHVAIRERQFGNNRFTGFCECWFLIDILLNFATENRTSNGVILHTFQAVCARYLTTWFVVDVLSLFPGEALYVRPLIEQQNRRGFFQKSFFRTKAVVRVTRVLRGRHFKLFGKVVRHTKPLAGMGAKRLLGMIIKYVPKYLLFYRNMKGVIIVRLLRQIHWIRKVYFNLRSRRVLVKRDDETNSLTAYGHDLDEEDWDEEDDDEWPQERQRRVVQVVYDWSGHDDDDDPF